MGRVFEELHVNGTSLWTLFDTGSRRTYVVQGAAAILDPKPLPVVYRVGLGGHNRSIDHVCTFTGLIQGKPVTVKAFVTDDLGRDEKGRPIEMLMGSIEMQNWGIVPVPHEERLDLTHYPEEFIEY